MAIPQGLPGSMYSVRSPTLPSQSRTTRAVNSLPFGLAPLLVSICVLKDLSGTASLTTDAFPGASVALP